MRRRAANWIQQQRTPRYDIWVSNTQVAAPWTYGPAVIDLWDTALGHPLSDLDGKHAGDVTDQTTQAAAALGMRRPTPDATYAEDRMQRMAHLCSVCSLWVVHVRTVDAISDLELVAGVLDGRITREDAIAAAYDSGTEAMARERLNLARSTLAQTAP